MSNVFSLDGGKSQPVLEKPETVINQELVESLKELPAKAEDGKLQNMAAIALFPEATSDGESHVGWQYIAHLVGVDAYLVVGHLSAFKKRIIDAAVDSTVAN